MDERAPLKIVAATRNPAKLRAFQRVVGDLAIIEPLPNDIALSSAEEARIEADDNAAAIAEQKALAWSRVIGGNRLVIASDGGLFVPALATLWKPTLTRRFAGAEASDLERARRLLELASRLEGEERAICWHEALSIAKNGRLVFNADSGGTNGYLATDVTPDLIDAAGGFWISALWQCPDFD